MLARGGTAHFLTTCCLLAGAFSSSCGDKCEPAGLDEGEELEITVLSDVEYSSETGECEIPHPLLEVGDTFTVTGGKLKKLDDECPARAASPDAPEPWSSMTTGCSSHPFHDYYVVLCNYYIDGLVGGEPVIHQGTVRVATGPTLNSGDQVEEEGEMLLAWNTYSDGSREHCIGTQEVRIERR